ARAPRPHAAETAAFLFLDHPDEVLHLADHAAHRRRVFEGAAAVTLVEAEPLQGRFLVAAAPDRAAGLFHRDGLLVGHHAVSRTSAARRHHRARARRLGERGEGGLDHVVRVRAADRFGDHVLHPQRLEDRPHRAAGDDAGARLGGADDDLAGAVAVGDVVVQRAALAQRHADHAAPRLLGRLADRLRHLARLARAVADPALAVADDDDRGKAEAAAALDHLGDAVDADELFGELAFLAVARLRLAVAAAAAFAAGTAGRTA